MNRTLRYLILPLAGLIFIAILLTVSLTTFAQEAPTATLGPEIRTAEPACQLYHVTVPSANVYSCAGASCAVITPLVYNTDVCVRGSADNSAFVSVDINMQDPASPLYYMSRSEVAPGRAGQSSAPRGCFSFLVNASPATVYQCAGFDCPVIGRMNNEDWVCGSNYGGQYAGWIYVSDSDSGLAGWVQAIELVPGRNNPNQPPDGSLGPTPGFEATAGGVVFSPFNPTITPAPGTLTVSPMPLCQQYYVTAVRANVRTCAGDDCQVVERIEQNETVCIRGIMTNSEWFYIDFSPEETLSELYAINKSVVAPGAAPVSVSQPFCEIYEVASAARALARQCPSVTCPALDALEPGSWICVFGYGGEYQEWLQADIPDGARNVWVHGASMKHRSDLVDVTPTPIGTEAAFAISQTPVLVSGPTLTPSETSSLPEVALASVPVCQPFVVTVASAAVRECASTGCAAKGVFERNAEICVLGVNPENSNWLVVDMTPGDFTDQNAYIGQSVVAPVLQVITATPSETPTIAPSATATVTVDPNLSPTPLFTDTPRPTIQPIFTLTPSGPVPVTSPTIAPTEVPISVGVPIGPLTSHEITLAALRVRNIELFSPLGSTQFSFRIPDNWTPESSNVLYLNFEYFEQVATNEGEVGQQTNLASTLEVLMDGNLVSTVVLDSTVQGQQLLAIPLPIERLQNPRIRNHTIQIRLLAEDHCLLNSQARLFIRSDQSYFHFEYRENSPVLNLAVYPRPLSNALLPNQVETVVVVLPSEVNETNANAASRISAGLGLLTGNEVQMQVVTDTTITDDQRRNSNMLLIGKPEDNTLIKDLYERNLLPTQLSEDGALSVEGVPIKDTDGVVQITTNPENPLRGIVVVTGVTDEALLKASQGLAGPPSIMGIGGPVTIISETYPAAGLAQANFKIDYTFADLGIDNIILNGIGTQLAEIPFSIPSGQRLTDEAYVEITYNYSELLSTGSSSITLLLNDEIPIASRLLNEEGGTGPFKLKGLIPPSGIRQGQTNTINIILTAQGEWECSPPDDSISWFTISRDSTLHLPVAALDISAQRTLVGQFPFPFNDRRDMRDVWVNLPNEPKIAEVEQIMRIMSSLGAATVGGEGFAPTINFGELPPGTDVTQYHFIALGRNTTNPFVTELNRNLPQPFADGTDQLQQVLDDVTYVLPPGYEVGVLQTLPSPWQSGRMVLLITGTGETGQNVAANALASSLYTSDELAGDVVFVSANTVNPINTALIESRTDIFPSGVNDLETETARQASKTPTPETIGDFTATPGPTLTPSITRTPTSTASPTGLFTPTATIASATPIPTFAPLTAEQLGGVDVKTPVWVNALGIMTVIVLGVVALYGLISLIRRRNTT